MAGFLQRLAGVFQDLPPALFKPDVGAQPRMQAD
jgi:LysR family hydrogen peroxide-inducible transcriptional activator